MKNGLRCFSKIITVCRIFEYLYLLVYSKNVRTLPSVQYLYLYYQNYCRTVGVCTVQVVLLVLCCLSRGRLTDWLNSYFGTLSISDCSQSCGSKKVRHTSKVFQQTNERRREKWIEESNESISLLSNDYRNNNSKLIDPPSHAFRHVLSLPPLLLLPFPCLIIVLTHPLIADCTQRR